MCTCSHTLPKVSNTADHCGATSTFVFESNLGNLMTFFHGTQYVPSQIVKTFLLWRELPQKSKCIKHEKVLAFFEKLYYNKIITDNSEMINNSVRVFGHPPLKRNVRTSYRQAISMLCENVSNCFWSYNRFLINEVLYHGVNYERLKKRNNSAVFLHDDTFCLINDLVIFKILCPHHNVVSCSCAKICCILVEVLAKSTRPVCKDTQIHVQSSFIKEVKKTGTVKAIWPEMIKQKCVLVETNNILYISPLPNSFERD